MLKRTNFSLFHMLDAYSYLGIHPFLSSSDSPCRQDHPKVNHTQISHEVICKVLQYVKRLC